MKTYSTEKRAGVVVDALVRPSRPLAPKGGNDRIYTPDDTASLIVNHFRPCGRILEPCSGGKAFVRALNEECEECEIDEDYFKAACARIERETAQESFIFPNTTMSGIAGDATPPQK